MIYQQIYELTYTYSYWKSDTQSDCHDIYKIIIAPVSKFEQRAKNQKRMFLLFKVNNSKLIIIFTNTTNPTVEERFVVTYI